jgi:hypothetical protein
MNPEHSDYCNCTCPQGLSYDKLEKTLNRVRMLHSPTPDGRSCRECSRIICLGTPNGLGGIQYPCMTILWLQNFEGDDNDA